MAVLQALNIFANPLITKSIRERLRFQNAVSWGLVVLVCTIFIYMVCYLSASNIMEQRSQMAAKWALLAIIVEQAVILMLMGTGAVATGIVQERSAKVLDYQRMTPMSPASKIIGYLFGLPIREYFLFALTMPVALFAAWQADVSVVTLLHLYFVGMLSVWLYHMTGMVAGMIAPKPWRAGVATQMIVLVMYFVLPMIGKSGFTFLLYLTPRPVLARLAFEELGIEGNFLFAGMGENSNVYFYSIENGVHPTLFTILVQGFFLVSLFVIVYRKWCDETRHPFPKSFSLVFYAVVQFLLLGSLWPYLTNSARRAQIVEQLQGTPFYYQVNGAEPGDVVIGVLLGIFFIVSLSASLLLIIMITPTEHAYAKGLRRAFKVGKRRVSLLSDAGSGVPFALAFIVLTWLCYAMLVSLAITSGDFFSKPPELVSLVLLGAVFGAMVCYIQGLRERWGMRGIMMGLFFIWVVPFMLFIVGLLVEKGELTVVNCYIGSPFPVHVLIYSITNLYENQMDPAYAADRIVLSNSRDLTLFCLLLSTSLAVVFLLAARKHFRAISKDEWGRFDGAVAETAYSSNEVEAEVSHQAAAEEAQ